jgi:peptidoglycan-associated lipoprotein
MNRIALAAPLALFLGCAHPQARHDPPPTDDHAPTAKAPDAAKPDATPPTPTCSGDVDCGARQLCINQRCVDITAGMAECGEVRLYFAFDSSDISSTDRTELDRRARCLKADQALHVRIEGHADERGTPEYNLALGDRRATTVAKYLERLGVSEQQLKTVSFGEERPLCVEHDESCWAKNRVDDVKMARSR